MVYDTRIIHVIARRKYMSKNSFDILDNSLFIFDLDGTLVDTSPDIINSVKYTLAQLVLPDKTDQQIRESIGGGAKAILEKNIPLERIDSLDMALELFKTHYDQNCSSKSFLYPNVFLFLEYLKSRGKKLAVYTFKTKQATYKVLKDYGIFDFFDCIVTKDDVKQPKPHPEGIYKILALLDYQSNENIVMIGDTAFDIETGKNANVKTIAVTYGYDPDIKNNKIQADVYIDDFNEIIVL
jgi:phosphoglycolate phosphatase